MRKVLIITYYWPPSGGVGVQRWLKFSKYLPSANWEPIIYTPENPSNNMRDETLFNEVALDTIVLKQPINEPFEIYNRLFGKKGVSTRQGIVKEGKSETFFERIVIWIRGNLFLPDARKSWVKPSIKYLSKYLKENPVDVIVTTGPPHSLHLIGLGLKKRLGVKWVADFRDPWTQWDVLPRLKTSDLAMKVHKKLEARVASSCDHVIAVSPRMREMFTRFNKNVEIITNGYDFDDQAPNKKPDKFRLCHAGLFNETKDVTAFWKALEDLCLKDSSFRQDLEISLAGNISSAILENLKNGPLSENLTNLGYLSHSDVFTLYMNSYVLLLFINQTSSAPFLLPAKLFEYIQVGRPILGLGPGISDTSDILVSLDLDPLVDYDDYEGIKKRIVAYYSDFKKGRYPKPAQNTKQYSRESLTRKLATVLDNTVSD